MAASQKCIRCGRDGPLVERGEYVEWEADEDGYLICPGCLTGEEHRWMQEEGAETGRKAAEAKARERSEGGGV
jgi:hypothetical protein